CSKRSARATKHAPPPRSKIICAARTTVWCVAIAPPRQIRSDCSIHVGWTMDDRRYVVVHCALSIVYRQRSTMPTIDYQTLRRLTQAIIEAAGTPPEAAQAVCDSLVEANLRGHDSHGVIRLPQYLDLVRYESVHPKAAPQL